MSDFLFFGEDKSSFQFFTFGEVRRAFETDKEVRLHENNIFRILL